MKTKFIIFLFIFSVHSIIAQNAGKNADNPSLDPSQVSPAAIHSFTNENPGIGVTWRADDKNYRASFIDPLTKMGRVIIYDKDGTVIRRENEVDQKTYPGQIKEYYSENHPGEVYQVWRSEQTNDGKPLYYSSRNDETIWFDKEGNLIPARRAEKNKKEK